MADPLLIRDSRQLQRRLETLATEAETSFALVFVPATPGEEDLPVIREAVKICDRVVVAAEAQELTSAVQTLLQGQGADIIFLPAQSGRLCTLQTAGISGVDATLMLQSILLVLPNLVVVSRRDFKRLRVLHNIQQTFGEITAIREV